MNLTLEHWIGIASVAAPLSVIALSHLGSFSISILLAAGAADWWNLVLKNLHDANHAEFQAEQKILDNQQDALFASLPGPEAPPIFSYIASELTRLRMKIDVMRIEEQARYDAQQARKGFSNFRIVLLWVYHRGNPKVKLDGGTKRRFMEGNAGENPDQPASGSPSTSGPTNAHVPQSANTDSIGTPDGQGQVTIMTPTAFAAAEIIQKANVLEVLSSLHKRGILTDDEFGKQKARLLDD